VRRTKGRGKRWIELPQLRLNPIVSHPLWQFVTLSELGVVLVRPSRMLDHG